LGEDDLGPRQGIAHGAVDRGCLRPQVGGRIGAAPGAQRIGLDVAGVDDLDAGIDAGERLDVSLELLGRAGVPVRWIHDRDDGWIGWIDHGAVA
jgi:hypothetical protein